MPGRPSAQERPEPITTTIPGRRWSWRVRLMALSSDRSGIFTHVQLSRAPARRAAGVAFEAGAVADQGEVAAFLAAVAFVALDPGGADALEAEFVRIVFLGRCRDGESAVELGRRGPAGA